jgi:hypothetical protein
MNRVRLGVGLALLGPNPTPFVGIVCSTQRKPTRSGCRVGAFGVGLSVGLRPIPTLLELRLSKPKSPCKKDPSVGCVGLYQNYASRTRTRIEVRVEKTIGQTLHTLHTLHRTGSENIGNVGGKS